MKLKRIALCITLAAALLSCGRAAALEIKEKSSEGTQYSAAGLTGKQLAIQRWLARLTFLNNPNDVWDGWYRDKSQLGLDSYRYSLAFLGYAAGAAVYKTPAYREVTADILDNAIQRMIRKEVWDYIKHYWKKNPDFPDPVVYENIMYSGHLMQLIALYESITGDMKYSTAGWDFVWDEKTKIHYDAGKLMKAVYDQIVEDERGGVPCEPGTIFIICNDHPHVAFHLYDAIHGTSYSDKGEKWRGWMESNGMLPQKKGAEYLKISYLRDHKMWTAGFGVAGADGWALAWMYPWTSNPDFVCGGWRSMYENRQWIKAKAGGKALKTNAVANIFGVNDSSGTSFYPIVEKQCLKPGADAPKSADVYTYFENMYGTREDTDDDGFAESYYYNTDEKTRIWSTANLFTGMLIDGESLKEMYNKPFYRDHEGEPYLEHADYPRVIVSTAAYDRASNTLKLTLERGGANTAADTEIICANILNVKSITLNGQATGKYSLKDGKLTIKLSVGDKTAVDIKM